MALLGERCGVVNAGSGSLARANVHNINSGLGNMSAELFECLACLVEACALSLHCRCVC